MNNKMNTNEQLSRMKSLMNYGLKTESKQAYSSVEYQKVGADGNVYGIVREGTKYYIKSAPNKQNLIKEDFSYIGGLVLGTWIRKKTLLLKLQRKCRKKFFVSVRL